MSMLRARPAVAARRCAPARDALHPSLGQNCVMALDLISRPISRSWHA